MDELQKIRASIANMEKKTSLRQVALQSGINYITLRNIKSGKSGRVTDSVLARFKAFETHFASSPESTTVRRGRKPAAAAAAPASAKPGRKAKVAPAPAASKAPAPKKSFVAKPTVKATPAPKPKAKVKAKVKTKAKGRPAAPKAVPQQVAIKTPDMTSTLLGGTLTKEIKMAEARLDFLKQLQKLESDFLKKIG